MARTKKGAEVETRKVTEDLEGCPVFILRADQRGHLRGLMAAVAELPDADQGGAMATIRDFELWMEANA